MKTCSRCRALLPLDAFHRASRESDGRRSECKACHVADVAKWQRANPDKVKIRNQRWIDAHLEQRTASLKRSNAAWRLANLERVRENFRRWIADHPDYAKKWRREHPELWRESARRRRALQNGAAIGERITLDELFKRDGSRCHICQKVLRRADASMDHLVPLSKGGDHSWVNVALAHRSCNSKRGVDRIPAQLLLIGREDVETTGRAG